MEKQKPIRRPGPKLPVVKRPLAKVRPKFTPKEFPFKPVVRGDARKMKSEALKRKLRRNMK